MHNRQAEEDPRKGDIEADLPNNSDAAFNLEFVSELGHGRAAVVSLVRETSTGRLYAEKKFKTGGGGASKLLRDFLYRLCFQASFPYTIKENAVRTSLYRRKVLRDLTEFWFGSPRVADACYVRWDDPSKSFVLGTEYIEGRGPKLGAVNRFKFRHFFHNYPVRLFKFITRSKFEKSQGEFWEIRDAVAQLETFKTKFHEAGFIGSEWQVNKTLSVPTSNLLCDENGNWILIDIESAFPPIIFLRDVFRALKFGAVPFFDDTDFKKLRGYLDRNSEALKAQLGEERVNALYENVDRMEYHQRAWKESEPAIFSHRHRLLTDSSLRRNIRFGLVDEWYLIGQISAEKADRLRQSPARFYLYFVRDLAESVFCVPAKIVHGFKKIARRGWRFLSKGFDFFYSAFFCEETLRELAESYTNRKIDEWQKAGRLTQPEAEKLREEVKSPTTVEYLKGFVAHIGLQALEPPFIGEGILVSLALYFNSPHILAAYFISPLLRTGYTIYRKIKNRNSGISYRYALLIGAFPKIGIFAYPTQMASTSSGLSTFLVRCQVSKFGAHFPLFGGIDSRLEHFFLKGADWFASLQYEFFGRRWRNCSGSCSEGDAVAKNEAGGNGDIDSN